MVLRNALALALVVGSGLVAGSAVAVEAVPTCNGKSATIVREDPHSDLQGTEGDDVVVLGPGTGDFDGLAGDDTICGGPDYDDIVAGPGDDWVDGRGSGDIIAGGSGNDVLLGGRGNDQLFDDGLDDADGADTLVGEQGSDDLYISGGDGAGNGAEDVATGGEGTMDKIHATSSAGVLIDVGSGTITGDAVDSATGIEKWFGSAGPDEFEGTPDVDRLVGGDLDRVHGRGGDDNIVASARAVVRAGSGDDRVVGSPFAGTTTVYLGGGNDVARFEEGAATVYGGSGADTFHHDGPTEGVDSSGLDAEFLGGPGADRLSYEELSTYRVDLDTRRHRAKTEFVGVIRFSSVAEFVGSRRADVFRGDDGTDRFLGREGNDVLDGRGGNDLLVGGAGNDRGIGGPGRDRCDTEQRSGCERR